jgi:hypothetical protein
MTEAMNIKTTKAKILMVAIVLAALVAAMAATAKPAEAATTCTSKAYAPTKPNLASVIYFRSTVECVGGQATGAWIESQGQYYNDSTGKWEPIGSKFGGFASQQFLYRSYKYALSPRINCDKVPGIRAFKFRTVNEYSEVRGSDGKWRPLPTRYSSPTVKWC